MSAGGRRALAASALAPLAVLAVLVAAVSAAVVYPGDDTGSGPDAGPTAASSGPSGGEEPDDAPSVPDGRQAVSGDGRSSALFTVPDTEDWTVEDGTSIGYQSTGGASEGVTDPAVYRADFCDDAAGGTSRAFVGFTRPVPAEDAGVQEAAQDLVDGWADALSDDGDAGPASTVTPVRLDDGSAAWTGVALVPVAEPESDCDPPAREVRVVSVASQSYVATVALVRDVRADGSDLDDGLAADEADDVLRTLSPQ